VTLAELQALFHRLVTAQEDVPTTVAAGGPDLSRAVASAIAGDTRLGAEARLDIYAQMYFARIHDVLREEAPRTAALLGAEGFHALVTEYLLACPPNHPSLREAGARLPAFLATHPAAAERPWLAELARLERTRLELVDGPDAEPLTLAMVQALPPEQIGELELRLIPSHALLDNRFRVSAIWRAVDPAAPGAHPSPPPPEPETLLVWRPDLDVRHRVVDGDEAAWLRRLSSSPISFGAVCEALAVENAPETAASHAFALVSRWLADGLLSARRG
jgi:hypothetical protein